MTIHVLIPSARTCEWRSEQPRSLWDVFRFNASKFHSATSLLAIYSQIMKMQQDENAEEMNTPMNDELALGMLEPAEQLYGVLQSLGVPLTLMKLGRIIAALKKDEPSRPSLAHLQVAFPYAPSWESYIRQIETAITAKHRTKSISWKRDESFYRDLLGNLQAIKIAWRNPTMHVVRRYSVEEAEEIYVAVRNFAGRLANRLPKSKMEKILS